MSAGVQFEGGESKIKALTNYCFAMQSSNDSLVSDLILENVREKASKLDKPVKIVEIVKMIRDECTSYKKEWVEDAILSSYNVTFSNLNVTPDALVHKAVNEVQNCEYPYVFKFIVLGIEASVEAHLYVIDQDGRYRLHDSLGFAAEGSGSELAFLELTKYMYSRRVPAVVAIPRVYLAKKVSERAQGVGRATDLLILFFGNNPKDGFFPALHVLSGSPEFLTKLDDTYNQLITVEAGFLDNLAKTVQELLTPKPVPQPTLPQPNSQSVQA